MTIEKQITAFLPIKRGKRLIMSGMRWRNRTKLFHKGPFARKEGKNMFVVFFALWVVFNGKLNAEIAIFGVVLSAVVYLFSCKFLGYSLEQDKKLFKLLPAAVKYLWLLICEIVKSNMALIRVVYSRKIEVKPQLVTFSTPLKGTFKSVLADCITVTPGTISVLSEDDKLTVHALDKSFAEGIEDTDFQKQLLEMQKKEELA